MLVRQGNKQNSRATRRTRKRGHATPPAARRPRPRAERAVHRYTYIQHDPASGAPVSLLSICHLLLRTLIGCNWPVSIPAATRLRRASSARPPGAAPPPLAPSRPYIPTPYPPRTAFPSLPRTAHSLVLPALLLLLLFASLPTPAHGQGRVGVCVCAGMGYGILPGARRAGAR